jgi:hypothetical protein
MFPWGLHVDNIIAIVWSASYLTAVCALSLVLFRTAELVKYCSIACKISTLHSKPFSIPSSLAFLLIYPFITFIFLMVYVPLANLGVRFAKVLLEFNYEYVPNACVELVVAAMCFVAATAFDNTDKRMKRLDRYSEKAFKCLIAAIHDHISVSMFSNRFGKHFSLHFINIFTIYVVQMVCYTVLVIRIIKRDMTIDTVAYAIHACYITGRLLFLCYWCQKVKVKVGWVNTVEGATRDAVLTAVSDNSSRAQQFSTVAVAGEK